MKEMILDSQRKQQREQYLLLIRGGETERVNTFKCILFGPGLDSTHLRRRSLPSEPPPPTCRTRSAPTVEGEEDFLTSTLSPFCHQAGWRPAAPGLEQIDGLWIQTLLQPVSLSPRQFTYNKQ